MPAVTPTACAARRCGGRRAAGESCRRTRASPPRRTTRRTTRRTRSPPRPRRAACPARGRAARRARRPLSIRSARRRSTSARSLAGRCASRATLARPPRWPLARLRAHPRAVGEVLPASARIDHRGAMSRRAQSSGSSDNRAPWQSRASSTSTTFAPFELAAGVSGRPLFGEGAMINVIEFEPARPCRSTAIRTSSSGSCCAGCRRSSSTASRTSWGRWRAT